MAVAISTLKPSVSIKAQTLAASSASGAANGALLAGPVVISGAVSGASGLVVEIYDGNSYLGTATLNGVGGWTFSKTLAAGAHVLRAVVVQPNGLSASSSTQIDLTAPVVKPTVAIASQTLAKATGVGSAGLLTNNGAVKLSGTVSGSAGTVVKIYDGSTLLGTATLDGKGGWTFSITLSSGAHGLSAVATDPAGDSARTAAEPTITVDTTKPVVSYDYIDQSVGSNVVKLYGTYSGPAGSKIEVFDGKTDLGAATLGASGAWSFVSPGLAKGVHDLTAVITSPAGNVGSFSGAPSFTVGSASGTLNLAKFHTVWNQDFTSQKINPNIFPIQYGAADQFSYGPNGLTLSSYRSGGFSNVGILQANWSASGGEGYGLYSATVSAPADQGAGLAILLWPSNNVWPGSELDMVENPADPTGQSAVFSVHSKNPVDGTDFVDSIAYAVDLTRPNTFALDWEAGSLTYYVDGHELFQLTGSEVPKDFADGGVNEAFGAQISGIGTA